MGSSNQCLLKLRTYRLTATSRRFTSCAFGADAPSGCPSDSSLTAHPTLMNKTMGVLGYGNIGKVGDLCVGRILETHQSILEAWGIGKCWKNWNDSMIFPCLGGCQASSCFGYESASDPTSWSLLVGMAALSCAYYFFCDRQEFYGRNNKLLCRRVIEASHLQLQALKVMAHQRQWQAPGWKWLCGCHCPRFLWQKLYQMPAHMVVSVL